MNPLNHANPAIVESFSRLEETANQWRSERLSFAICHGCFDPLHPGHILHFKQAAELADRLIVTITRDIHIHKGPGRPFFTERLRLLSVSELRIVDAAALSPWPSAVNIIEKLRPAFFVKGPDYRDRANCNPNINLEEQACLQYGGRLTLTSEPSFSSTNLIRKWSEFAANGA